MCFWVFYFFFDELISFEQSQQLSILGFFFYVNSKIFVTVFTLLGHIQGSSTVFYRLLLSFRICVRFKELVMILIIMFSAKCKPRHNLDMLWVCIESIACIEYALSMHYQYANKSQRFNSNHSNTGLIAHIFLLDTNPINNRKTSYSGRFNLLPHTDENHKSKNHQLGFAILTRLLELIFCVYLVITWVLEFDDFWDMYTVFPSPPPGSVLRLAISRSFSPKCALWKIYFSKSKALSKYSQIYTNK